MWICSSKTWNIGGMSLPPSPKTLRIKSPECEQRSSSVSCEISNNLEHGAVPLSITSGKQSYTSIKSYPSMEEEPWYINLL